MLHEGPETRQLVAVALHKADQTVLNEATWEQAGNALYCRWPLPGRLVLPGVDQASLQRSEPSRCTMLSIILVYLLFVALGNTQANDPATLSASIKLEKNYSLLPACINQCVWDSQ